MNLRELGAHYFTHRISQTLSQLIVISTLVSLPVMSSASLVKTPENPLKQQDSSASAQADPILIEQLQLFQKGLDAAEAADWKQAYSHWAKLSAMPNLTPQMKRAVENNLAVVLIKQKKYDAAEKRLDSALKADREVAIALENLNEIYAYQAQKAYKTVFEKTRVVSPKGKWLSLDMSQLQAQPITVLADAETPLENKQPISDKEFEVRGLLEGWRQAWSSQDVDLYLSYYDRKAFVPKNGMSLATWEKSRYRNLRAPKFIKVFVDDIQVTEMADGVMRTKFLQRYQSDRFNDDIYKILLWKQDGGEWKIIKEVVVYDEAA